MKHSPRSRRLRAGAHRLLHSFIYFVASIAALALFYVLLMLAETAWYGLTGHAVSVWAMAFAALVASLFFSPIIHFLQRMIDRIFYRRRINMLQAIRDLGSGDLARLADDDVEIKLLKRLADICQRKPVFLDERDEGGRMYCYPPNAPLPLVDGDAVYELKFPMIYHHGSAMLFLGPRQDGWQADAQEIESVNGVIRFASMSLEHARLTRQQVEEARLDSITRIMAQLHSHDLKNRLHDLAFLAHHINAGKLEEDESARMVEAIRKVVGRMQTVMQRMSDPNTPIHPKPIPCNLQQIVQHLIDARLWPEGVRIHDALICPAITMVDQQLLESVLENLFDNAVQAMDKQGDLYVSLFIEGEMVNISIRDTGCGIDADFLQHRLFRLFSTSKESGLGIGLYLSQRIIVAHAGALCAQSDGEGKGSTFIIGLPLWQDSRIIEAGG